MSGRNSKLLVRTLASFAALASLTGAVIVSCEGDPIGDGTDGDNGGTRPASHAMSQWSPDTRFADECPQSLHDTYFVIGPDGKKYPTWHPSTTTDPATGETCTFGHEHGHEPRLSSLWDDLRRHFAFDADNDGTIDTDELNASGIPFGYVAEQLDAFNNAAGIPAASGRRWQGHTGYKIAYANDVPRDQQLAGGQTQATDQRCHVLVAYHQSAHDADAFASNLHQVTYAIDCKASGGSTLYAPKLIASGMAASGNAGEFLAGPIDGALTPVAGGVAVPSAHSPATANGNRQIPDTTRVHANVFVASGATSDFDAGLRERWRTEFTLRRTDNTELAAFDPAFDVLLPARFWANGLARSVDLCYSGLNASGQLVTDPGQAGTIVRQVRNHSACAFAPFGPATQVNQRLAFDALNSPFNGCARQVRANNQRISNAGGPTTWYTNPFGANAGTASFPGSVKQFVAATSTAAANLTLTPAVIDINVGGCAAGSGVHVPN